MVLVLGLCMEEKQDCLPQMGVPCTMEQQVPGATKGEEISSRHFSEDELVVTHGRRNLANPPHCNTTTIVRDHGDVNWEELNNHDEQSEGRRVRAIRAKCRVMRKAKRLSPQNSQ
ncbi:hypothetical protein llap_2917 [Limosa lapponica baueri]|uniref:Uncharacterized protein n=1 Tax=Limosa lapponica baueri TaxID=1758121 RepID=A0A2I0ULD0_LIMLA|nr:hypothetical protein llap_2917 [Limosa lapponica baueri]